MRLNPAPAETAPADARARILQAAEALFAERGVAGTTLRAVTAQAETNIAAVNYHFGGKENLAIEVFRGVARRSARRRLALLAQAEARSPRPSAAEIIETFLDPYLTPGAGALLTHLVLSHRVSPTPWTAAVVREELDDLSRAYVAALHRAAPHLTLAEVHWRYHFMVGAILLAISDSGPTSRMTRLSDGLASPADPDALRRQLVGFLAGAFNHPAAPGPIPNDGPHGRDNPEETPCPEDRSPPSP